ncbi:helix-turn-helix transcriptional regulator [Sphingobacterium oryzagri]|uniref:Helix-turn-helix transcriptional regulator n=1 Tax=Sphingobacterium oryzagri TaxID=3025669 RepID=A0ABY7WEA2_9SPHI|nr:AraC family transcriptional regulator [Sphingobacterium sp. KACC 22765]WDF66939.1 helix-turn-helix transcriptional regulator [Sphingobacterium sp. KACC 22765]
MNSAETITIDTVEQYTKLFRCPSAHHPLLSICQVTDIKEMAPIDVPVKLNLYFIVVKDGAFCTGKYGWRPYDFSSGAMSFFSPGQIHLWNERPIQASSWGWMLAFHPDFIRKSPFWNKINKLKLFSYETNEALHISDAERSTLEGIIQHIQNEYHRSIDMHSQDIILAQLDVLLSYSERFYTRQFRTRSSVETDLVARLQSLLHNHFSDKGNKTVAAHDLAAELSMSRHYLSDLLRKTTGMSTQQHIHAYLIERSKTLLLTTNLSVSEVAYSLGFEYPQYFSRLFKSKTGQSPLAFRRTT